jgi:hypothetical protein
VRGGTSFLFPTAKKKRSKENAYKRQPVGVSLAQPRPWSENRTVPADQPVVEHPSCLMRHRTLRPHGRNAGRTGLVSSRSGTPRRLHKPFTTFILLHAALHASPAARNAGGGGLVSSRSAFAVVFTSSSPPPARRLPSRAPPPAPRWPPPARSRTAPSHAYRWTGTSPAGSRGSPAPAHRSVA